MTHLLVTGGAGYIGSHVCKRLSQEGYTPVTFDNLSTGHREAVKWGPLIEGDLSNKTLLRKTVETYPIEGVFHFAASTNVRESLTKTMEYFQNNVGASLDLLEVLVEHKINTFIFSSSCAVYGIPETLPIDETHPRAPINGYGESKAMVEDVLLRVSQNHGMHVALLRYFNAAGSDFEGEIGENQVPQTHLIPLLLRAAKEGGTFTLYGNDHATEDGTALRDYIHVEDLAEAHVKAFEWIKNNHDNLLLNLGTGRGHSVKEVIELVEEITQKEVPIKLDQRNPGDPPKLFSDPSKAKKVLGWQAKQLDLRKIIESTWNWMNV
ncbi:MAG: UDP-glucose 4-epimerase GalE [Chlamydiales bacterium]|nr:UDP-glucose 4-epimerase GalE [Chlamydiales bacterium]